MSGDSEEDEDQEKQFSVQGETVAVFYDNCFYIGEVLEVEESGN